MLISAAMSTSSRVERAESRFSIVVATFAEANSKREIKAPTSARASLICDRAPSMMSTAAAAFAAVPMLAGLPLPSASASDRSAVTFR
ncbi:MAG: hypothetical protein R3C69_07805 [Geminicoccaceae bacterium]